MTGRSVPVANGDPRDVTLCHVAQRLIDERDSLARLSSPALFVSGPSNILLHLYVAVWRREPLSMRDLAAASNVPETTSIRYIALLERLSFLITEACHEQAIAVRMTDVGFRQFSDHLRTVAATWGVGIAPLPAPAGYS